MAEPNRKRVVSASEIGQFTFCEKSWELKRGDGTSLTQKMEEGKNAHVRYAEPVEALSSQMPPQPFRRQEIDWSPRPMPRPIAQRRQRWDWLTFIIIALSLMIVAMLAILAWLIWSRQQ